MARTLTAQALIQRLQASAEPHLDALYLLTGDEILLTNEVVDAIRAATHDQGYTERISLTLDARADWSSIQAAIQSISLFGERRTVSIAIPSGRPGRTGSEALQALAETAQKNGLADVRVIVMLPRLDRASRSAKWMQALSAAATTVDIASINRNQLPAWIGERLARQQQQVAPATLAWIADRVEGNLLAAFQEIQKLGLLYPEGKISQEDVERAVLNVARYNVFDLRDAMLAGQAARTLSMLRGLAAEGEALPLVLWAIGDEIRTLARLAAAREEGTLQDEMRRLRIFRPRDAMVRQALDRIPAAAWPALVRHAQAVDSLIKGLRPAGRLHDAWAELERLALRVALGPARRH